MKLFAWWVPLSAEIGRRLHELREVLWPRWRTVFVESDILPDVLPRRRLVVAREGEELWSAGMICPCGCGETIELGLFPEAEPSWELTMDDRARPSLSPSVWRRTGCRAHFFMRSGRVYWC